MRLQGKSAVVTGSTRGIGAATALRFAREGAAVVVTGRSAERGQSLVAAIAKDGGRALFVKADLNLEGEAAALMERAADAFGALHILVNNAAPLDLMISGAEATVVEQSTEQYEAILRVGQYAPFWCCKYAIPHMIRAGGGAIVNISSIAGSQGAPASHAYTAAKGAMDALTRQIAADFAADGVRCNTLMLGGIRSGELADKMMAVPAFAEAIRNNSMLGRLGEVDEVASACLFLASDEASYVTGAHIACDGGQLNKMYAPKFPRPGSHG